MKNGINTIMKDVYETLKLDGERKTFTIDELAPLMVPYESEQVYSAVRRLNNYGLVKKVGIKTYQVSDQGEEFKLKKKKPKGVKFSAQDLRLMAHNAQLRKEEEKNNQEKIQRINWLLNQAQKQAKQGLTSAILEMKPHLDLDIVSPLKDLGFNLEIDTTKQKIKINW